MININEIMIQNVITLKPDDSLQKARELMSENNIRHIPVINDALHIVGLITQRDLLKASAPGIDTSKTIEIPNILVSEIMTRKIKVINQDERLIAAGLVMEKYKYGCIPVVNNKQLVGIITETDFVGVAINLLEQMEQMEQMEQNEDLDFDDL